MAEEHFGRLDDEAEAEEQPSAADGPSAAGEYDPREGSPGMPHPAHRDGDGFSEEITHYATGGSGSGADAGEQADATDDAGTDAVPGTGS